MIDDDLKKFAESGYDIDTVDVERIGAIVTDWAIVLTPIVGLATYEQQESRGKQWSFVLADLVGKLQQAYWDANEKIESQRQELIEVRKELSKLRRGKQAGS